MYDQCNLWAILTVFLKQGGYLPISFTEGERGESRDLSLFPRVR